MEATSLRFAAAARSIGEVVRGHGLAVPSFRSPPQRPDVDRTLRRRPDGGVTVSVRLKGRPWVAVVADMIEGAVVANGLSDPEATRLRSRLWSAVEADVLRDSNSGSTARSGSRSSARSSAPRVEPPVVAA